MTMYEMQHYASKSTQFIKMVIYHVGITIIQYISIGVGLVTMTSRYQKSGHRIQDVHKR